MRNPQISWRCALALLLTIGAGGLHAQAVPESLEELAARVLPRSPQVRSAEALTQVAVQRLRQADSRLYAPTLEFEIDQGRERSETLGQPLERRTDRAQAALRWNIYNAGSDKAEQEGARRDALAAGEDLRRAREEVAERLAQAYVEALRHWKLLPRSQARLDALRVIERQAQLQNEAGKMSDADRVQASTSVLEAEIDDTQLRADLQASLARLRALAGGTVGTLVDLPAVTWGAGTALPTPEAAMPAGVAAANLRAQAAQARVLPESSLYAPRIDLRYDQQLRDQTRPALTEQTRRGWQIVARWELPLGGEKQARREEGVQRARAAEQEAERLRLDAQTEGAALPERIHASEAAIAQLQQQDARYETLLRAAALQFEAGRRSLAQLTQLHESRYALQQRMADAQLRARSARLRLHALAGDLLDRLGVGTGIPAQR